MVTRYLIILALTIATASCTGHSKNNDSKTSLSTTTNSYDKNFNDREEDYPNDKYCADVTYYNPHTTRQSFYRLTVEVENNEIITVNFPNGGTLDQDHFSGAELDKNGNASLTSDKGYKYEVQIRGQTTNCFNGVATVNQCRGITKAGKQCRHLTDNPNGLCWQHQNQK